MLLLAGAATAPLAGAASPLPLDLQVATKRAFPGSEFVRLCQHSLHPNPPPDLYGYALVRSGRRQHTAVFQFINTAGWYLMMKDSILSRDVAGPARARSIAAKVTAFCERRLPTSRARMCGWQFNTDNLVGSWSRAENRRISSSDRAGLRAAYAACHTHDDAGPAAGSVYFARYGGYEWAIGEFAALGDQPETFVRPAGQTEWADQGDTGGELCESRIPFAVLKAWGWTRPSTVGAKPGFRCFVRA